MARHWPRSPKDGLGLMEAGNASSQDHCACGDRRPTWPGWTGGLSVRPCVRLVPCSVCRASCRWSSVHCPAASVLPPRFGLLVLPTPSPPSPAGRCAPGLQEVLGHGFRVPQAWGTPLMVSPLFC